MKIVVSDRVVIGTAIGFTIAAVLFVAYKQHDATKEYGRHRTEYCASLTGTSEQKKACQEEGKTSRDYLPWGYELLRWPEGIEAWAIIATGIFIAWQSYETRKSAGASAESAKIAKAAHDVQRSREKPRFSIAMTNPQVRTFQEASPTINYFLRFRCPTHAFIKSAQASVQARPASQIMPPSHLSKIGIGEILDGTDAIQLSSSVSGEADFSSFAEGACARLMAGEIALVFLINIIFTDIYGDREFQVCKILRRGLANLTGTTMFWADGPAHLQIDR